MTSRERTLRMIETCAKRQIGTIAIELPCADSRADPVWTCEFIPEEPMGNGEPGPACDVGSVSELIGRGEAGEGWWV